MNEDWPNQLAAFLAQQDQPPDAYWEMMAANDRPPALVGQNEKLMNAYINQIQGAQPQQPQQAPQQQLQNQAARQGLATLTPQELQRRQLAEIMRRRSNQ